MSAEQRSSLRIGFRVGVFPKLSETFVLNQINGLLDHGHDVTILADKMPATIEPTLRRESERAASRTRYISETQKLSQSLRPILPFRVTRALEAREEHRLLETCDVIICNFGWFGARMAEVSRDNGFGSKLITILHGDDMSRHLSNGNEDAYDELVTCGGLLLSVNRIWQSRLKDRGAPDHVNLIHHLGVDPGKFDFVDRQRSSDEAVVLATVCRIVEKKGLATTLQALKQVRTTNPNLNFVFRIYGDGPLRESLTELSQSLELSDIVEFMGSIPNAEVRNAFADADVFVHPSVTANDGDMEGLPISMMEAMATGLPVISTYHSGIPELIEHGQNGLLSTERDVEHLAEQLARIIADTADRRSMGRAARKTIETEFSLNTSINRLEGYIKQVAHGDFNAAKEVAE